MADTDSPAVDPSSDSQTDATPQTDEQKDALEGLTIDVADCGPARKAITIEVSEDRVQNKVAEGYTTLQDEAVVPGFRKGRAPRRLLERRFGTTLKQDVKGQIISDAYQAAIEKLDLDVVGQPSVKDIDTLELPESGPFSVTIEVEVVPTFELPDLNGIQVERPSPAVTDEDVQEELDRLCERNGGIEAVEDGTVEVGDYVQADARVLAGADASDDAEQLIDQPGTHILVNGEDLEYRGHVLGILVNDLGKQLLGKKAGDVVRISMDGPAGHEDDRIKGKPITLVIRVTGVSRVDPVSPEDLAAQFGLDNAEELTERVQEMLAQNRERQSREAMRRQVCDHLLEKVQIDLPEGLSAQQTSRVLQNQAMQLMRQGVPMIEIEQRVAELRAESETVAARQLRLLFILDQVAEKFEIEVNDAEINAQIVQAAVQQQRRPERLRQEMQRNGQLDQMWIYLRQEKALDKILETAMVIEQAESKPEKKKKARTTRKTTKKSTKKQASESDEA